MLIDHDYDNYIDLRTCYAQIEKLDSMMVVDCFTSFTLFFYQPKKSFLFRNCIYASLYFCDELCYGMLYVVVGNENYLPIFVYVPCFLQEIFTLFVIVFVACK